MPWTPYTSWWAILALWLVFVSTPGRVVVTGLTARLLTIRLRPGSYHRGGWTHLRLWTAERLVIAFHLRAVAGTPLALRYARLLGCRVGRDVLLHTMPPVTGLAAFDDGCVLEPEADAAGWWIEGDLLHVGTVRVGADATVGTRSMLMPGVDIGAGSEIAPGSCVSGHVPAGERWHGTPARKDENCAAALAAHERPAPNRRRTRLWNMMYTFSLPALQLLPLLAAVPAMLAFTIWMGPQPTYNRTAELILTAAVPLALLTVACYALLIAATVRLASRAVKPGLYPAHGRIAWCVWVTYRLMDTARSALFPLATRAC